VILAAGIGRRFGGLKQLEPVGPNGEAIMDYTVFDASRAGFGRVALVIRRETEAAIRAHVENGFGRSLAVDYVFQELDELPAGFTVPDGRTKPWGTGHAVLVARSAVGGRFAVANADDFYGAAAWFALGRFLAQPQPTSMPVWAMVGFRLGDTLPADGSVSRALCRCDADGWLVDLEEILAVHRCPGGACFEDGDGVTRTVDADTLVSMNLFGFTPDLFGDLERRFHAFLAAGPGTGGELFLPVVVRQAVDERLVKVKVLPASGRWCGITSAADREAVAQTLRELAAQGEYPGRLWS